MKNLIVSLISILILSNSLYSLELKPESIDIGIGSKHTKRTGYNFNETNYGVILNWKYLSLGYINKNSFEKETYIISGRYNIYDKNDIQIDTKLNFLTGYDGYSKDKTWVIGYDDYLLFNKFLPLPSLDITYKNIKVSFIINPLDVTDSVIYYGYNIKF